MRHFLVVLVAVGTWGGLAFAQGPPKDVDLSKAKFYWAWEQGTGGPVEKWLIRCGLSSGSYTLQKELVDPGARSMLLTQILTAEGQYFCIVNAANSYGVSVPSTEVSFRAGKMPAPVSDFGVSPE